MPYPLEYHYRHGTIKWLLKLLGPTRPRLRRGVRGPDKRQTRKSVTDLECLMLCVIMCTLPFFGIASIQYDGLTYYAPETTLEAQIAPQTIEERITDKALEYGVNPDLALYIASKESGIDLSTTTDYLPVRGDMHIKCKDGSPVEARGIFQITQCHWGDSVSDQEADDVDFAIEWSMKHLAKGEKTCKQLWTTCRHWYNQ